MAGFYKDDKEVYDFFKRNIGNEEKIRKRDLSFVPGKGYTLKNIDKTDFISCPTTLLFSEKFFNTLGKELEQEMEFIPCKLICENTAIKWYAARIKRRESACHRQKPSAGSNHILIKIHTCKSVMVRHILNPCRQMNQ